MRRLARAAAAAAIAALLLSSCDVLFKGRFASDVAQTTARIDLSSSISASAASSFTLSIIAAGNLEFVLLVSGLNFDSSLPHLLVFSPQLKPEQSWSIDDLAAVPPLGIPFTGGTPLFHLADGKVVIGNLQTSPSATGLTPDAKLPSVVLGGWTIEGPQPTFLTWSSLREDIGAKMLFYFEYPGDWSTQTARSHLVSSGTTQYDLVGVFTNPTDSNNNTALMAFSEMNTSQGAIHFILVPKNADFINQFPGPPIMENTQYTDTQFVKTGLESDALWITTDSIIGYDAHARALVRFSPPPSDPSVETRLEVSGHPENGLVAFSFAGGYYCTWDPATRTLTRYEKWW